jgi:hypothetical protein
LWWTYSIAGQPVGYVRETSRALDPGASSTTVETRVVIGRLGSKVEIRGKATYEEAGGKLRLVRSESSSSQQTTALEAEVRDDTVRVSARSGGKDYRRSLPYTGPLLGPEGARKTSAHRLKAQGDTVSYQMFVPELEAVRTITRKVLGKESVALPSGRADLLKVEEQIEGYPSKRTVWLDGERRLVRHQEPGPFGITELNRSDRAAALRAAAGQELPADVYDRSLVRANVRLPSPRTVRRAVLRLTQKDPGRGWPAFEGPTQKVLGMEKGTLILEVRQEAPAEAAVRPTVSTPATREYLEPNAVLQSDDPLVQKIAREAAGDERDVFRAARKLEGWVSRHMTFDPGIALAPASEVARHRRGTCMAYAALLAALARAAGIPSRVVMGYVYVSGAWGGHAWVEVLVGKQWVALDGAIPGPGACDAARLCGLRTSLAGGLDTGALLRLYGNVEIAVLEYETAAGRTQVPAGAKSYVVEGDVYNNPWLAVTLRKPSAYTFIDTDAVYPDTTVVGLKGPQGQVARLRQESAEPGADGPAAVAERLRVLVPQGKSIEVEFAGRSAAAMAGPHKAALAVAVGTDLWVLTAEGGQAAELLGKVAKHLKLPAGDQPVKGEP